jgi:putative transport protein
VVWSLPYGANVTLQQIGLILLLASLGIKSGSALITSLSIESLWIILASGIISIGTAFAALYIGYKWMKKPFGLLMGMVSNQPAILDFSLERSGSRLPNFGFTMIFPIALILKILIAQMLFIFLN